ncbi:hypothetical protein FRX31_019562 [Thalictrum thalictroides]|uniref:Uncharacterized protein n=1 Tax=Thalictrum thalictroides TaxID=46969 RepID=A0A7J6W3E7_THATH|nr:hypothetical protein FRX31_019562 [Thalictrum thalictroides]
MMDAAKNRSNLVKELWNAAAMKLLVQIWKFRNKAHFDNLTFFELQIRRQVLKGINTAGLLATGAMNNDCQDLQLLRILNAIATGFSNNRYRCIIYLGHPEIVCGL